ncbi:MAG TPA: hypothetical protein VMY39_06965 [Planctomycetota bacterium]|nr:hypothetical protein [Planctomycetota bacterium]
MKRPDGSQPTVADSDLFGIVEQLCTEKGCFEVTTRYVGASEVRREKQKLRMCCHCLAKHFEQRQPRG